MDRNDEAACPAASSRELAFRLLYIRRPGAGVRRLFTPGRKVGGLFEKAGGDIRIRGGHCKFQKGCRLFRQIFFSRHYLVPRHYPLLSVAPDPITRCGEIRSGGKYKSEPKAARVRAGTPPVAASVLAEKSAGFLVINEAGCRRGRRRTHRNRNWACRRGLRKPMLHIRAQPRAFENYMSAHSGICKTWRRSPPYVCVVGVAGGRRRRGSGPCDCRADLSGGILADKPAVRCRYRFAVPQEAATGGGRKSLQLTEA